MVHASPPSRQSSPLIDAAMRPPRSARPAPSGRPVFFAAAAFVCLLVVLLRGQHQNTELQRHLGDTQLQDNPFSVRGQQRGARRADQPAVASSDGTGAQQQRGSGQLQAQPEAAAPHSEGQAQQQQQQSEQQPLVQPSEKPAGQPAQQQAAAAEQQAAAGETTGKPEPRAQPQDRSKQAQQPAEPQPQQQQQTEAQQQQGQQQQQVNAGDSQGSSGSSNSTGSAGSGGEGSAGSDSSGGEGGEGGPTGGWGDSFIKQKADGYLGNLLDQNSLMSPLRTCAADGFSLEVQEREAEDLLADLVAGRPALTEAQLRWASVLTQEHTLVSGTAHNLPCAARRTSGSCCSHPVSFRRNTTDYRVFKQVFQCHYMRYLYTLFGEQPPKYILDAGANAGFSTILFKLLWPEATVVMLEPDPSNFAVLTHNTATLKDVHPINAGLWGRTANITVKANHGNWGKVFQEAEEGQPGMPAYSVADVARQAGVPAFDFVKIDIEGAEGQVFAPGRDVSWIQQARAVSLELHDFFSDYFGLRRGEISACVDAAFSPTGYTPVSDNEHIIYLNQELQASVSQLRVPLPKLIAVRSARLKKISGC